MHKSGTKVCMSRSNCTDYSTTNGRIACTSCSVTFRNIFMIWTNFIIRIIIFTIHQNVKWILLQFPRRNSKHWTFQARDKYNIKRVFMINKSVQIRDEQRMSASRPNFCPFHSKVGESLTEKAISQVSSSNPFILMPSVLL